MKLLIFFPFILPLISEAQFVNKIQFNHSLTWSQVRDKANAEGKYLFVDLYATWCGPCKIMDTEVYSNDSVSDKVNTRCLSIKIQMDSTSHDDDYVRSWYAVAKEMRSTYHIVGYPSFLFFTPDGKLILKEIGYKSSPDFINMLNKAIDPKRIEYYKELERYEIGVKELPKLGELAFFTKTVAQEEAYANIIARDFIVNYLNKISDSDVIRRNILLLLDEFYNCVSSQDKLFTLCYNEQAVIDSCRGSKGWAVFQVRRLISREEIEEKVLKDGKATSINPSWSQIVSNIEIKYPKIDAKQLVLEYKIDYYRFSALDWKMWAQCVNDKIQLYPPRKNGTSKWGSGLDIFGSVNLPAWDAFQNCNDKSVLAIALKWSELSIKLEEPNPNIQYLDTRANLLYKLGRINEAIRQEQKAVKTAKSIARVGKIEKGPFEDEFILTVNKMRKHLATWPQG